MVVWGSATIHTAHAQYNCAAQADVAVQDCEALVAFMDATNVQDSTKGASQWGSGDIEDWQGVFVEEERVVVLNLHGLGITGFIPVALAQLSAAKTLSLGENQLAYFEEGSYDGWQNLELLGLVNNAFTELPDLSGLPALQRLWVFTNSLTFEDLEPMASLVDNDQVDFRYWPMRPVVPHVDEASGTISIDVGGANTTYQWYRGPFTFFNPPIAGATGSSFTVTESGTYYATAENTDFPELTLRSEDVFVEQPMTEQCESGWTLRDDFRDLPSSIEVFEDCSIPAFLVRADASSNEWKLNIAHAYSSADGLWSVKPVSALASGADALLAINGGYFSGNQSTSLVASAGELLIPNQRDVVRDQVNFKPTRATLGVLAQTGVIDLRWTYQIDATDGSKPLYAYPEPAPNAPFAPASTPSESFPPGGVEWHLSEGVGGGPMLVYNGQIVVAESWEREVFFSGGGIGAVGARDPRTSIGLTDEGELLMIVTDGRCRDGTPGSQIVDGLCGDGSEPRMGLSHAAMADSMLRLGAVKAMNLDGGGSSTLVVGNVVINEPSDGRERPVASAVALVPVSTAGVMTFDFEDSCCYHEVGEWIEDPDAPTDGGSPARLNEVDFSDDRATWTFTDIESGAYELAATWTVGNDRARDTPYTIFQNGVGKTAPTTIRVDQSDPETADRWNVLGEFDLAPGDSVSVTDDATALLAATTYVVADAVRLTPISAPVSVSEIPRFDEPIQVATFPNPLSESARIEFQLQKRSVVRLTIYDALGRLVREPLRGSLSPGRHSVLWKAAGLSAGMYLLRLEVDGSVRHGRMVVTR